MVVGGGRWGPKAEAMLSTISMLMASRASRGLIQRASRSKETDTSEAMRREREGQAVTEATMAMATTMAKSLFSFFCWAARHFDVARSDRALEGILHGQHTAVQTYIHAHIHTYT